MSNKASSAQLGDVPPRNRTTHLQWWVFRVVVILVAAIALFMQFDWVSSTRLYQESKTALKRGDYAESMRLGRRLMLRDSHRAEGMLFVAESSSKLGHHDEALHLLEQVRSEKPSLCEIALLMTARIQCDDLHRPFDAERTLVEALRVNPSSLSAHEKLAFLLGLAGRSWEATQHRLFLVTQDQIPLQQLSLLALGSTAAENPDLLKEYAQGSPDDVLIKCGLSRIAMREGRVEEAETLIDEVIRCRPSLLAAQAWKGELLLHRADDSGLAEWQSALPANANEFPDIWFVRGGWAVRCHEPRAAVRCFWECLRRDAIHQSASYQISQVLEQLGESNSAALFRQHAHLIGDLITAAKTVEISGSFDAAKRAVVLCDALGLKVEADAWRTVLRQADPNAPWQVDLPPRSRRIKGGPRSDHLSNPALNIDYAAYPLPRFYKEESFATGGLSGSVSSDHIRFTEQALAVGIDFNYRNGSQPSSGGEYMYEFSGGGVVAFDYDVDGWPDIYFSQGSDSSPLVEQDRLLDRIYRNLGGNAFSDCTTASGIHEPGFSQGCAAGDFDNDGFPDLYVANIGANRFFHNNGDGTFTDVTVQTGTAGDRWTTSCAIADVNGDGNPDLFTVNYVTGKGLLTTACRMPDGSTRLCTPHEFPAAHDQLFINLGDGRFEDRSQSAGIEVPEGKGLGLVVGSFDYSGRLGLFVANDAVPNFFFANVTAKRGDSPQFEERGYLKGLAVDADGQPQACMGVAAGDANGDGLLDLYVTNFRNESNTLYLQQLDSGFVDATRSSGLREPSFAMLGFGTQFLDADLDGWQDLIVTNGHVGNLKHHGVPYEMPPQFYRNLGKGNFVELPASTLGPFFNGQYLGRGLARLDWNRDGRDDFAISHVNSSAALVTNQTINTGHFLTVQLVGVESDRDAIGSIVTVHTGHRRFVQHLTAGDGYQACNQRQMVFGLGESETIDRLEVQWPIGKIQRFASVAVDCAVLLIEGRFEQTVISNP
jgi:tetratricopeptide (TPR) repeat protein